MACTNLESKNPDNEKYACEKEGWDEESDFADCLRCPREDDCPFQD